MEIQKFEEINRENLTPIMQEYYDFKIKYPDFIVLFQVGSFFETYFDDAKKFSYTTGCILTRKKFKDVGDIPLSGVKTDNVYKYIEKLIAANYKVILIEQFKEKDKFKRHATKTYTPGTLVELEFLNPARNNYIASVCKKENYQLCYADLSVGQIYFTEGSYDEIKNELGRISPKEILIPKNMAEAELYSPYNFETLNEDFYKGEGNLALSALLGYAKFILNDNLPLLDEPVYYSIKENVFLDFNTRKNLELTKNSYNGELQGSLLWALDRCKTPMGKRLLAEFISTPISNFEEIQKRLDTIEKLLNNIKNTEAISDLLNNAGDLSRLSSKISTSLIKPLEFLVIKNGLKILADIRKLTSALNLPILAQSENYEDILFDFYEILEKTFEDDIEKIKEGNFIKKGANAELDLILDEIENNQIKIKEYEDILKLKTGIKSLKIVKKAGCFLIETSNKNAVSSEFNIVSKNQKIARYTTPELLSYEEQVFANENRALNVRKKILADIKEYSKEIIKPIRKYSKKLALLDVFVSLCFYSKENNFVRPIFSNNGEFKIKEGWHVTAEAILKKYEHLDIEFKDRNFVFLTGANGAGKSTLLKQTGVILIMAHSGFFVPAKYALMPFIDALFTILNVTDDFINKKSTHQSQMNEIAKMLPRLTKNSVALLDEIGRNTFYKDGFALCFGLINFLIDNSKANVIFATHFTGLQKFLENKKDKILYLQVKNADKRTVEEGVAPKSEGIKIAEQENIPSEIIEYAKSIINSI